MKSKFINDTILLLFLSSLLIFTCANARRKQKEIIYKLEYSKPTEFLLGGDTLEFKLKVSNLSRIPETGLKIGLFVNGYIIRTKTVGTEQIYANDFVDNVYEGKLIIPKFTYQTEYILKVYYNKIGWFKRKHHVFLAKAKKFMLYQSTF